MKIHFDHNGQNCIAELTYNLKEVPDCVIVIFEDNYNEDILFSNVNSIWTSTSDLQARYPQTYSSIVQALALAFDVGGGWQNIRIHRYLS